MKWSGGGFRGGAAASFRGRRAHGHAHTAPAADGASSTFWPTWGVGAIPSSLLRAMPEHTFYHDLCRHFPQTCAGSWGLCRSMRLLQARGVFAGSCSLSRLPPGNELQDHAASQTQLQLTGGPLAPFRQPACSVNHRIFQRLQLPQAVAVSYCVHN